MVQPEQGIVRREHRIHHVAANDVVTGVVRAHAGFELAPEDPVHVHSRGRRRNLFDRPE